jgi:hypothetical protein
MSQGPFRFVHASDFHLENPLAGVADVPEHLRDRFIDAPYQAATRVFDAALAEEAQFLILAGDLLQVQNSGPRGPLFLAEQFARLAARNIPVYWAGGAVDPPEDWPAWLDLPANVHVFPRGRASELLHERDGAPAVRLIGASRDRDRPLVPTEFTPDPSGLFTIGVVHGGADAAVLQSRGLHYWALGGRHDRTTLFSATQVAHDCGTPQGRSPREPGVHGCTLVQVDEQSHARTSLLSTDAIRWTGGRAALDPGATRADLEALLRARLHDLAESATGIDLLISWTISGSGPLMNLLGRGPLAAELLAWLRNEYGAAVPARWSVAIDVEPAATLPSQWYEQETIRGDFLRELRQYQMNPGQSLALDEYLDPRHLAGTLGQAVAIADPRSRERVLCEAALLGVDLLSGEEPQS